MQRIVGWALPCIAALTGCGSVNDHDLPADAPATTVDGPVMTTLRCDPSKRFGVETPVDGLGSDDFQQSISLTADERTAYVALAVKQAASAPDFDIYKATRADDHGAFSTPTRLAFDTTLPEPDVAVSADGKLMVISKPGPTAGDLDLWQSAANADGEFTSLTRLDQASKTGVDDLYPTLSADGSVVYFSRYVDATSNNDVYASTREKNAFTTPVLVPGINSTDYENGAVMSADQKQVVFNRGDGMMYLGVRASTGDAFTVTALHDVEDSPMFGQATWMSADGCHLYYESSTYEPNTGAPQSTRIYVRARSL